MRTLVTLLKRSLQEFSDDHCTHLAAAISYYVLFSLFPLLVFLVAAFSFVLDREDVQEQVVDGVLEVVPLSREDGSDLISDSIDAIVDARGALGVLGVIGVAWSASSMFATLRTALNIAWDIERRRPLVQQKLLDLAMVLGVGALFGLSLGATLALQVAPASATSSPSRK